MKFFIVMRNPFYLDLISQDLSLNGWIRVRENIYGMNLDGLHDEAMGLRALVARTLYGFFTRLGASQIPLPPENAGFVVCESGNKYSLKEVVRLMAE